MTLKGKHILDELAVLEMGISFLFQGLHFFRHDFTEAVQG